MTKNYQVIVSNIGTVYSGHSLTNAESHFVLYQSLSDNGAGTKTYGEDVTVLEDGEPIMEYLGTLSGAQPERFKLPVRFRERVLTKLKGDIMSTKDYQLDPLKYLQQPDHIWRPYAFDRVTVSSSLAGNLGGVFSILGICYSEFRSGPNLRHLADVGGATLGQGYYGLQSCRYIGYQICT